MAEEYQPKALDIVEAEVQALRTIMGVFCGLVMAGRTTPGEIEKALNFLVDNTLEKPPALSQQGLLRYREVIDEFAKISTSLLK